MTVGPAVGIRRHSSVIHIWRFESYWARRILGIEYCFIKWRKVRVYAVRVGADIVAASNGPGREWIPDVGLRRIRRAVIVQCMSQPSRRSTKCPPWIAVVP